MDGGANRMADGAEAEQLGERYSAPDAAVDLAGPPAVPSSGAAHAW
jgi:hypothetical protein